MRKDNFPSTRNKAKRPWGRNPRSKKMRLPNNLWVTPELFEQYKKLREESEWSRGRIIGEALEFYMASQPHLYRIYEKVKELKDPGFVRLLLRTKMEEVEYDIDTLLDEIDSVG